MSDNIKKFIIFLFLFANNINAQEIKSDIYKFKIINEDFSSENHDFPIIRENDNYFILDEDEYLTIRKNNKSEYAIIIENSLAENSYLKTKFKLGPSKNNTSVGIIASADKNFTKALVVEINKKGEYRIKQLNTNNYIYLSGKKRKNGWVRNKNINKENEYNILELIDNKNNITLKINDKLIQTFDLKINKSGYYGLLLGKYTKARVSYYYLNSDKAQPKVKKEIVKNNFSNNSNPLNKNEISNNNKEQNNNSKYLYKIENLEVTIKGLTNKLNSKAEEHNKQLESKELELKNSKNEIQKFENLVKDIINKDGILSLEIEELKKDLVLSVQKAKVFKEKNNVLFKKNTDLNIELKEYQNNFTSLNNKLLKAQKDNIKKSDISLNDQKEIKDLKSKIDRSNSIIKEIRSELKNTNSLLNNLKEKLIESSKNQKEKNKLANSQISKLEKNNKQLNLKIEANISENARNLSKYKNINVENKEKISQLSLLINTKNMEISTHIKTNQYLKEIFVYKDFELNGITPSTLIVTEKKPPIIMEITNTDSSYTIQLGVFTNPINNFKSLDKIWIEQSNNIYTFYHGQFINANDATKKLNKLIQLGYRNMHIIKKKNKTNVTK
jgi:hypothetical protein